MTNTTPKTARVRNKIIASVCAVFAATAMVTGIAVFSASASDGKTETEAASVTTTAAAQTKTEVKTNDKAATTEKSTDSSFTEQDYPEFRMLGFNFEAVKANAQKAEQSHSSENSSFLSGKYADSSKMVTLEIENNGGTTCFCTVTIANEFGNSTAYSFMGTVTGKGMTYTGGSRSSQKIAEDGTVLESKLFEKGHSGTITKTEAGLEWKDNDGVSCLFKI